MLFQSPRNIKRELLAQSDTCRGFWSKLKDQILLDAAYWLILGEGEWEDRDLIIPTGGSRRVGLYAPDTMLLSEADSVVEQLENDGYLTFVEEIQSGYAEKYPQAAVWYSRDPVVLNECVGCQSHVDLGRAFGYSEEAIREFLGGKEK